MIACAVLMYLPCGLLKTQRWETLETATLFLLEGTIGRETQFLLLWSDCHHPDTLNLPTHTKH